MCNKKISVILEKAEFFVGIEIVTAMLQIGRDLKKPFEIQWFHVLKARNSSPGVDFGRFAQNHLKFTINHTFLKF